MHEYLTMAEAAEVFPAYVKDGEKRHIKPRAVARRITHGIRGVKLQGVRDGRAWFTTRMWIEDFQRKLTERAKGDVTQLRVTHQERLREYVRLRHGIVC